MGNKLKYILLLLLFLLSGCAGHDLKEEYDKVTNPPTNWYQQAEFYTQVYPECTNNQKALMLIEDMEREGCNYYINRKIYKIEVIYIYDDSGRQIWPVKRHNDKLQKILK